MKQWLPECLVAGHVAVSASVEAGQGVLTGICARCGKDIYHSKSTWRVMQVQERRAG